MGSQAEKDSIRSMILNIMRSDTDSAVADSAVIRSKSATAVTNLDEASDEVSETDGETEDK